MTSVEHSEVQFGRTLIEYDIRRSSKRRTVAVTIFPAGNIILTAPTGASVERLDRVVHQKARWITSRLRSVRPFAQAAPQKEFVSGDSFLYLGRQYRLRVLAGPEEVRLDGGRLLVRAPEGRGRADRIRGLLVAWYRARAEDWLPARAQLWADRMGMTAPNVLVREQELRWGSCSANGVVRFNWRVIQAPARLVDYVVAHEVLHLRHPDHTKAFWSALGSVMPDVDSRRTALRGFGGRVDW
ncbi:MAG: SprT family zinc-dependent metalloprotease [Archangium sp.]|nr:SprT family zinc-dependent metalloprotease [Archangium sp.]